MTAMQQRFPRKSAWRLLPILTLAYVVNYLDRTNIGFAALTMNKELGLTATQFGYGAGILFAGYCAFEIPSNLARYHYGARLWIARIMISLGGRVGRHGVCRRCVEFLYAKVPPRGRGSTSSPA